MLAIWLNAWLQLINAQTLGTRWRKERQSEREAKTTLDNVKSTTAITEGLPSMRN